MNNTSYITEQEFECIKRLPLGYSAKQIGRELNISFRSVRPIFRELRNA